jgi:hypothetical protein
VQIFIGGESGIAPLDECSVVTAPYEVDGQIVGTIGVIGPTRMAYERVIPIVDITAKLLSSALSPPESSPEREISMPRYAPEPAPNHGTAAPHRRRAGQPRHAGGADRSRPAPLSQANSSGIRASSKFRARSGG